MSFPFPKVEVEPGPVTASATKRLPNGNAMVSVHGERRTSPVRLQLVAGQSEWVVFIVSELSTGHYHASFSLEQWGRRLYAHDATGHGGYTTPPVEHRVLVVARAER